MWHSLPCNTTDRLDIPISLFLSTHKLRYQATQLAKWAKSENKCIHLSYILTLSVKCLQDICIKCIVSCSSQGMDNGERKYLKHNIKWYKLKINTSVGTAIITLLSTMACSERIVMQLLLNYTMYLGSILKFVLSWVLYFIC